MNAFFSALLRAKMDGYASSVESFPGDLAAALSYDIRDTMTLIESYEPRFHTECQTIVGFCWHYSQFFDEVHDKVGLFLYLLELDIIFLFSSLTASLSTKEASASWTPRSVSR